MRPEKARRLITLSIKKSLSENSFAPLVNSKNAVLSLLRKCVRRGDDSESYYTPETEIGTLNYISDRFCCSGRLRWMLQKIELEMN